MINGFNALIILGIIIAETFSQTLAREYRGDLNKPFKWKNKFYLIAGAFLLYALVLYLLVKTYDYSNFAISNAMWDSGTIIATTLVGYFWFNEHLNKYEYTGLGLVIAGAILIGLKSDDKSSDKVKNYLCSKKLKEREKRNKKK